MLEDYSKSVKIAMIATIIIGLVGIFWGIFEVEEWPFLIFIPFMVVMLSLLFSSRFFLNSKVLKPIYIGILIGIALPIILLFLTLLIGWMNQNLFKSGGGSYDMAGLSGIFFLIFLIVFSTLSFFISTLIGLLISYKNSKNKIVLLSIMGIILSLIGIIVLVFMTEGNVFRYF
ncbi:hypothetical protein HYV89_01670 [Candidatus Woesearchaeota archaeon]|nr:hypothetical protein [Candidatus Woesearchaeota archaeon]